MITRTRKESEDVMSDSGEIIQICADFYRSLYTKTVPTLESAMKSSQEMKKYPNLQKKK